MVNSLRIRKSFHSRELATAPPLALTINSIKRAKLSCNWLHRLPESPTTTAGKRSAWRRSFRINCERLKTALPSWRLSSLLLEKEPIVPSNGSVVSMAKLKTAFFNKAIPAAR